MKARKVKGLDPRGSLAENAARIVRVRLDELRSHAAGACDPRGTKAQHDMRIAAKRLRYVLEVSELCLGEPARNARRRASDLQDILGELHDCDVMLPRIHDHVAALERQDAAAVRAAGGDAGDLDAALAAKAPNRSAYRGLETLAVYVAARRRLLFDRFVEYWAEQEQAGTWDRLGEAAQALA